MADSVCSAADFMAASAIWVAIGRFLSSLIRNCVAFRLLVGAVLVSWAKIHVAYSWRSAGRGCIPIRCASGRNLVESVPASCTNHRCMSFDALAPHYRWMELVLAGEKLQRCRTAFLNRVSPPQNILIWGEGNGRFLVECRRAWKQATIVCADASGRMLASAKRRLEQRGLASDGVEFLRADVLQWSPPKEIFDLIVTHFFLDCLCAEQLQEIIEKLGTAARQKAAWLLADFQSADFGLQRIRTAVILKAMYLFFRFATRLPASRLIEPDPFLTQSDFILSERRVSEWGLLHSDFWERGMGRGEPG